MAYLRSVPVDLDEAASQLPRFGALVPLERPAPARIGSNVFRIVLIVALGPDPDSCSLLAAGGRDAPRSTSPHAARRLSPQGYRPYSQRSALRQIHGSRSLAEIASLKEATALPFREPEKPAELSSRQHQFQRSCRRGRNVSHTTSNLASFDWNEPCWRTPHRSR